MYAFLHENCNQVEYVSIGKNDRIRSEVIIKNNELEDLIHKQSKRLNEFVDAINNQVQLTALADDDVCDRCEIRGLCRKGFWKT